MKEALIILYFVPAMIAFFRDHSSKLGILALNFFLGITIIGWLIALIWSLSNTGHIKQQY